MGDRAYGNPPGVEYVSQSEADVLVRINLATLPLYGPKGQRLRVLTRLQELRIGQVRGWPAWVRGPTDVIAGRLVAIKKSRRAAQAARRALRRRARKKGQQLRAETLKAASYVILFTTLPRAEFPARRLVN